MHIHKRGQIGEECAAEFLLQSGYKILERNWKFERNEIDLICLDNDILVFVEVKTRATEFFGFPEEAVDPKKERAISKAANAFLRLRKHKGEIRFDIVSVIIPLTVDETNKKGKTILFAENIKKSSPEFHIYHITDAFFPGL